MVRRIALYGGGFNPPHLAHLFTVTYLHTLDQIDEVWLLPSHRHAFQKTLVSFSQRVKLIDKAFAQFKNVKVCPIEFEPEMSGRTYDTLNVLSLRYTDHLFSLVIGSDNLSVADQWHRFDDIIQQWPLIVMQRPGFDIDLTKLKSTPNYTIGPLLPSVSSTAIRENIESSKQFKWKTPPLCWLPESIRVDACRIYTKPDQPQSDLDGQLIAQSSIHRLSICIWGQGKCGGSLANHCQVLGLKVHNVSLRDFQNTTYDNRHHLIIEHALDYDIWLIAAKDDAIEYVSNCLAEGVHQQDKRPKLVAHCSGSISPQILHAFSSLHVPVAQCHPLYSFKVATTPSIDLHNIVYAMSGEPSSLYLLTELVQQLQGIPLTLTKHQDFSVEDVRVLYHVAAVFGANLSLLPLALCGYLLEKVGVLDQCSNTVLQPLYKSALAPYMTQCNSMDIVESVDSKEMLRRVLTGPLIRRDVQTLERHLKALFLFDQAESSTLSLMETYLSLNEIIAELLNDQEMIAFLRRISQDVRPSRT